MPLPNKGSYISMNDIQKELSKTGPISLNDKDVRFLANRPNGIIKLSDFYGKQVATADYVFKDGDDFQNRIMDIAYKHNGDFRELVFGFENPYIIRMSKDLDPDGYIKTTPKKIVGIGCSITTFSYMFSYMSLEWVSPELFDDCSELESIAGLFAFGNTPSIPYNFLSRNKKIKYIQFIFAFNPVNSINKDIFLPSAESLINVEYSFGHASSLRFIPELWNGFYYPNISTYKGYAASCTVATNYNMVPEGWK